MAPEYVPGYRNAVRVAKISLLSGISVLASLIYKGEFIPTIRVGDIVKYRYKNMMV